MGNVNRVILMGNLTRDPELRYTPNGSPVCEFGMAINRTFQGRDGEQRKETCFVDVTMWGKRGAVIHEYFKKGASIFIEGRLQFDTWETAEGKRSKLKVVAENFEFVSAASGGQGRKEGDAPPAGGKGRRPAKTQEEAAPPAEEEPPHEEGHDVKDDEIPF